MLFLALRFSPGCHLVKRLKYAFPSAQLRLHCATVTERSTLRHRERHEGGEGPLLPPPLQRGGLPVRKPCLGPSRSELSSSGSRRGPRRRPRSPQAAGCQPGLGGPSRRPPACPGRARPHRRPPPGPPSPGEPASRSFVRRLPGPRRRGPRLGPEGRPGRPGPAAAPSPPLLSSPARKQVPSYWASPLTRQPRPLSRGGGAPGGGRGKGEPPSPLPSPSRRLLPRPFQLWRRGSRGSRLGGSGGPRVTSRGRQRLPEEVMGAMCACALCGAGGGEGRGGEGRGWRP